MLGARAETNETGGQLAQKRKPFQQTDHERQRIAAAGCSAGDGPVMNEDLHALNQAGRPLAPRLHLSQIVHGYRTASQFFRE